MFKIEKGTTCRTDFRPFFESMRWGVHRSYDAVSSSGLSQIGNTGISQSNYPAGEQEVVVSNGGMESGGRFGIKDSEFQIIVTGSLEQVSLTLVKPELEVKERREPELGDSNTIPAPVLDEVFNPDTGATQHLDSMSAFNNLINSNEIVIVGAYNSAKHYSSRNVWSINEMCEISNHQSAVAFGKVDFQNKAVEKVFTNEDFWGSNLYKEYLSAKYLMFHNGKFVQFPDNYLDLKWSIEVFLKNLHTPAVLSTREPKEVEDLISKSGDKLIVMMSFSPLCKYAKKKVIPFYDLPLSYDESEVVFVSYQYSFWEKDAAKIAFKDKYSLSSPGTTYIQNGS